MPNIKADVASKGAFSKFRDALRLASVDREVVVYPVPEPIQQQAVEEPTRFSGDWETPFTISGLHEQAQTAEHFDPFL